MKICFHLFLQVIWSRQSLHNGLNKGTCFAFMSCVLTLYVFIHKLSIKNWTTNVPFFFFNKNVFYFCLIFSPSAVVLLACFNVGMYEACSSSYCQYDMYNLKKRPTCLALGMNDTHVWYLDTLISTAVVWL